MRLFLIKPSILIREPEMPNHILIFASNEKMAIERVISTNVFTVRSNHLFIQEVDTEKTVTLDVNNLVFKGNKKEFVNGQPNVKEIKIWLKAGNNVSKVIEISKSATEKEIKEIVQNTVSSMIQYDYREL